MINKKPKNKPNLSKRTLQKTTVSSPQGLASPGRKTNNIQRISTSYRTFTVFYLLTEEILCCLFLYIWSIHAHLDSRSFTMMTTKFWDKSGTQLLQTKKNLMKVQLEENLYKVSVQQLTAGIKAPLLRNVVHQLFMPWEKLVRDQTRAGIVLDWLGTCAKISTWLNLTVLF